MLNENIVELKKAIIKDASLVEEMITKAINGLENNNKEPLISVIEVNEKRVNKNEIAIDEQCINTIALYQPEAKDLRTIISILKMNNDIERMGDQVVNIAKSSLYLIENPMDKNLLEIPTLATDTLKMFHDSINAFINENTDSAIEIVKRDDHIDNLKDQIVTEVMNHMSEDPLTVERGLNLIRVAQNFERIADLSTNICEDVCFMVTGQVIKHHKSECIA